MLVTYSLFSKKKLKLNRGFPIDRNGLSKNEVGWVQTSTTTVSYVFSHIGLFDYSI